MDDNGMTDKILSNAQDDIRDMLKDDELSHKDKKILDVLGFVLTFIISDRQAERGKRDWYFKVIMGAALSTIVMLVVNGIVFVLVNIQQFRGSP